MPSFLRAKLPTTPIWLAIVGPAILVLVAIKIAVDLLGSQNFEILGTSVEVQNGPVVFVAIIVSLAVAVFWFVTGFLIRRTSAEQANFATPLVARASLFAAIGVAAAGVLLLIFAIVLRTVLEVNVAANADGGLFSALSGTIKEFGWNLQSGPSIVLAGIAFVIVGALWYLARPTAVTPSKAAAE
jgi:hypothetical protein